MAAYEEDLEARVLAALARALPLPLGWAAASHPDPELPDFWHNELSGVSTWHHPIDEFVKTCLHTLRTPLAPRSLAQIEALVGADAVRAATSAAQNAVPP